jgi:hypothetical protein
MSFLLIIAMSLLSWLLMMMVHEAGHVLHALLSGGVVTKVVLHPLAISRTDVAPNPHPHFVVWGGPIWGCALPLLMLLLSRKFQSRIHFLLVFFAGFCLIANGAYLGVGAFYPVGDAEELMRLGTPRGVLIGFGIGAVTCGLLFWNGLGRQLGLGRQGKPMQAGLVVGVVLAALLVAAVEAVFSEGM